MAVAQGFSKITTSGSVFMYDTADTVNSYKGEPTTNMWGIETGGNVNGRSGWDMPYAYNGAITNTVYSNGTWNGNRIWEVLHTLGTSGYGGYESWRLCVNQPTAGTGTYSTTRRVAIKICLLEGSITDMTLHSGGGNGAHNAGDWTPIPESQVPRDCPVKTGWYQFLANASWNSDSVGHCVGLGFISYNRVRILTTEPMYYPSDHLIPFTGYQRTSTEGLVPLVNSSTINLSSVSFDSNAQIVFDGTDDRMYTSETFNLSNNFTFDFIIKPNTLYDYGDPLGATASGDGDYGMSFVTYSNGSMAFNLGNGSSWSGGAISTSAGYLTNGTYYHIVGVCDGGTLRLYKNGIQTHTGSTPYAFTNYSINIGNRARGYAFYPFNGYVATVKAYNRALTAGEILNNYNHYKTKYNLL